MLCKPLLFLIKLFIKCISISFQQHTSSTFNPQLDTTPLPETYAEEGIIESVLEVNYYNACPSCKSSVKDTQTCVKCNQEVTPQKMPRCEVLLSQEENFIPITLFQNQLAKIIPDLAEEDNITEKIMDRLPVQIQFTKSPKKSSMANATTSLAKIRLVQTKLQL